MKKIYRSGKDKMVGGVCGGLGEHLDMDPKLIRIFWIFFVLSGGGLLAYIVFWIMIPRNPTHLWN